MTTGVVGLGLIGGSLCKAIKKNTENAVFGFDIDNTISTYALMDGGIDKILDDENLGECDFILLCVYPKATVEFLKEKAKFIKKGAIVIDCGGVKKAICESCFDIAKEHGFTFIGGHPMAGLHHSGYKNSTGDLFIDASMILTPQSTDDISMLENVTLFIKSLGFGSVTVTTPDEHDTIIAFTSQLAHVVSNAYVKSPTAKIHKGFSAGSYKDLTRVAWLNPQMWAELFLENREKVLFELDTLIHSLEGYRTAIENGDQAALIALLEEGKRRKEEVDG